MSYWLWLTSVKFCLKIGKSPLKIFIKTHTPPPPSDFMNQDIISTLVSAKKACFQSRWSGPPSRIPLWRCRPGSWSSSFPFITGLNKLLRYSDHIWVYSGHNPKAGLQGGHLLSSTIVTKELCALAAYLLRYLCDNNLYIYVCFLCLRTGEFCNEV